MVDWVTLVKIAQEVYSRKARSEGFDPKRGDLMKDLGEWWSDGGKERAAEWTIQRAREWAERNVEP